MIKKFEKGDKVKHKITGDYLIIMKDFESLGRYRCRYFNKITGSYESQEFYDYELIKQ